MQILRKLDVSVPFSPMIPHSTGHDLHLRFCAVLFIIEKIKFATPSKSKKLLKVTVPENLNFQDEFNNILSEYTVSFEQVKIKTTELGSLFEVVYNITVDIEFNQLEMINKIRCVNGNLSIILNDLPYTGVNL